ncbi:hypothetical protein RJ640_004238 [Escallonia rubra]|uniref:Uncharacterized protein n=1 Tax=Escallonia rubra TaxID=112253 RepID=A0AA88RRE4_9ASTE|nr:hypothetical protein RJ640_004238 [Escallonia rubra]
MGRLRAKSDYEDLRNARISENKVPIFSLSISRSVNARLESLGLRKTISELRSFTSSPVSVKRKERKVDFTSLRRSGRLKGKAPECTSDHISLRRSHREKEGQRPANAPWVRPKGSIPRLSPDILARRCASKSRGSVYDPFTLPKEAEDGSDWHSYI